MVENQEPGVKVNRAVGGTDGPEPPSWLEDRPLRALSEDRLNFRESAEALARQLVTTRAASGTQSLSLSLEGPWGSGKSSYSKLLIEELEALNGDHGPLVVSFNVWQSGATPLSPWSALAYRIGKAFYADLHQRCCQQSRKKRFFSLERLKRPRILLGRPKNSSNGERTGAGLIEIDPVKAKLTDPRLHWLEVAQRLSLAVPKNAWMPCLNLFGDTPSKIPGRGLAWQQGGLDAALSLGHAGLSVASGGVGDAISGIRSTAALLFKKRLVEGPAWGADTLEFVRQLNQLLVVLHPKATAWRCIIVVDDITRLSPVELPPVLEALGYLREMRDVLVLLNLDGWLVRKLHTMGRKREGQQKAADEERLKAAVETERSSPPPTRPSQAHRTAEPFLTRLVNLRVPIPRPRSGEIGSMLRSYFEDLQLPPIWASKAARHLLAHNIRTPRQVKRALLWLWTRLGEIDIGPNHDKTFESSLLCLLLDFYLLSENQVGFDAGQWCLRKGQLMRLSVQPWDLRYWYDKNLFETFESLRGVRPSHSPTPVGRARLAKLEKQTLTLIEHLRWLSVVNQFDEGQLNECIAKAKGEYGQWQETLSEVGDGLESAIETGDLAHWSAWWSRFVEQILPAPILLAMIELASIARRFDLAEESTEGPEKVLLRWFDYDEIFRLARDPRSDPHLGQLATKFLEFIDILDTLKQ